MEQEVKARFKQVCTVKIEGVDVSQGSVSTIWNHLKKALLESVIETCGKTKKPLKKRETWWWNEEVKESITK